MKTVSINDLKARLAHWLTKVGQGESIQVTKHNKPCALLTPVAIAGIRYGARLGAEPLTPVLSRPPDPDWLSLLLEDRDE